MAMPEAASVQKLRCGILVKQYRVCRGVFTVQFVAVSICMQKFTHQHFGLGVFAFNAAHVVAAVALLCTSAMVVNVNQFCAAVIFCHTCFTGK